MSSKQVSDDVALDVARALDGEADALERVLKSVEPLVFALALRMLGHRDDALDATQEILLSLATHLSEFRGDSRFSTWAYRVAANALLDALRARGRRRERSFSDIAADVDMGLKAFEERHLGSDPVTPEDRISATEFALLCTQGMLMALDPRHRLAYILGDVLELSSEDGALVADVTRTAFQQRLARGRRQLRAFMGRHCGLVATSEPCRCDKQVAAVGPTKVHWLKTQPLSRGDAMPLLRDAVARRGAACRTSAACAPQDRCFVRIRATSWSLT